MNCIQQSLAVIILFIDKINEQFRIIQGEIKIEMNFKEAIARVQDCTLIQIFLQFVQNFHLQYQKIIKEISYKCYQANWIMASTKATGYGRTQPEAYKHALRNLIELLLEQEEYKSYFKGAFQQIGVMQRKLTIKEQIKTEVNQVKLQKTSYLRDSQISNKDNSQNYCNSNKTPWHYKKTADKEQISNQSFKNEEPSQIHYSKIQLNKSICSNQGKNLPENRYIANAQTSPVGYTDELSRAKDKLKALEVELSKVNKQNKILRERINSEANQCASTLPSKLDSDQSEKQKLPFKQQVRVGTITHVSQSIAPNFNYNNNPNVPKLKLDVLPNYHKKSEKSLNDSMLAAYQQKYVLKKIF